MTEAPDKETLTANGVTEQLKELQAIAERQQAEQEAQAQDEQERNRSAQIEQGSCSIIPFPRVRTQPVRSELTIEQNSLFVANRYQEKHFTRERELKEPSGNVIVRRLTVGKVHKNDEARGVLKQVHQDVFYRLLQLWGECGYGLGTHDGKTYGSFTVSAYRLVTAIRNNDSVRDYQRVQSLLQDMSAIPIVLETERKDCKEKDRQQFTLLNGVRWDEMKLDKQTLRPKPGGKSEVTILFSSMVTEGFLDKHYKTLLGKPYESLGSKSKRQRGELARLLYPYLDAQLATKDNFHVCLKNLSERFGLSSNQYKSYRKRKFMSAVCMLGGKLILSEHYRLRVTLKDSSDGSDYILVARREPNNQLKLFQDEG